MQLNVGAGNHPLDGFRNYDVDDFNIRDEWPFADGDADYIHMSHVLEHVTRIEAYRALGEALRVLKDGGVLHLAVPDMDKFVDCRISGDYSPLDGYRWTDFNHFLGGNPEEEYNEHQRHKYMWCYASLAWTLQKVGFRDVAMTSWNEYDTPQYYPISLYVDAVK